MGPEKLHDLLVHRPFLPNTITSELLVKSDFPVS